MEKLLYRGSVKDIFTTEKTGELAFLFSDRYSVFDWGEMPDQLPQKGESLAFMGRLFFQYLERAEIWRNWQAPTHLKNSELDWLKKLKTHGLKHHCLGQVDNEGRSLLVKKIEVPSIPFVEGRYDYSFYLDKPKDALIPLEVIFRFGLPTGSSLVKRLDDGDYRRELGLNHKPSDGESFNRPLIEFSTKLESSDRYINYEEAQKISGLSDWEFSGLYSLNILVACRLKDFFSQLGITLWDGKFEWSFGAEVEGNKRELQLVDSIGPDELRLEFSHQKLSKEFLRTFYRGSDWLEGVEKAKKMAKERGQREWKDIALEELKVFPKKLDPGFLDCAQSLYPTLANTFAIGAGVKPPFSNALELKDLCEKMNSLQINGGRT